jgi:hypothetical protein
MKLLIIVTFIISSVAAAVNISNPDYKEFRLSSEVKLVEIGKNLAKLEVIVNEYQGEAKDNLELNFDAILDKTSMLEEEVATSRSLTDSNFYKIAPEIKEDLREIDLQIKRLINIDPKMY